MHLILRQTALFLITFCLFVSGCSDNPRPALEASAPATPAIQSAEREIVTEAAEPSVPAVEDLAIADPASLAEPPADSGAIERSFFAAQNDPPARIAAIRELANVPPAAALTTLNRLFSVERREDVKAEMLATLGDLDHTKERDNQLALCIKALAANQPQRIRYIAIHTLVDLQDPRAHGILHSLKNDPDREIRAATAQALSDLAQ